MLFAAIVTYPSLTLSFIFLCHSFSSLIITLSSIPFILHNDCPTSTTPLQPSQPLFNHHNHSPTMVKKGVLHKSSGRPRTFIGVIQGVTRDLQAQREAREQQSREDRLCESLRQTDITPRPLEGPSGRRADDDLFTSGRDRRDSLTRGRGPSYDYDRSYPSTPRPRPNYSARPYRSPSPPPRYSASNSRSAGLQRSATLREDTRTRTRDFHDRDCPSRLSSVPENRQPHYRDLEVRAIEPGDRPRQVQLGRRSTVTGRQDSRVPPAELRGDYPPPSYERTRDSARELRSGRERYDECDSYRRGC